MKTSAPRTTLLTSLVSGTEFEEGSLVFINSRPNPAHPGRVLVRAFNSSGEIVTRSYSADTQVEIVANSVR